MSRAAFVIAKKRRLIQNGSKMKLLTLYLTILFSMANAAFSALTASSYGLVVEGFDWGPSASKVVLDFGAAVEPAGTTDFKVKVNRHSDRMELPQHQAYGERVVLLTYASDEKGNRKDDGTYLTLVLSVSPENPLDSPMQYIVSAGGGSNYWIDYQLEITQQSSGTVWNQEARRIRPIVDDFDLGGVYSHPDGIQLTYALYTPEHTSGSSPLIIWLHGGGEGGTDPSTILLANRAANYASKEIQSIFEGAYVLAPQTPTRWMHGVSGQTTWGQEEDIYHEALMGLFKTILTDHPQIDRKRIYVGGCSNGGYMSLRLLINHPGFFAAGYISALAFAAEYVSEDDLQRLASTPIWFVHSADDEVTPADRTVLPLYHRLRTIGAEHVHLSYYDHVVDITGLFGSNDYRYNGHFSWIYHHANHCRFGLDGEPVRLAGRSVAILEWLAAQRLQLNTRSSAEIKVD